MSLYEDNISLKTKVFPKPKYSQSSALIISIEREIIPRPERVGFSLSNYPLLDLARMMTVSSQHKDLSWAKRLKILNSIFPEVGEGYVERHPERKFTPNKFRMRVWNGVNNGEYERYSHLMPEAIREYFERVAE